MRWRKLGPAFTLLLFVVVVTSAAADETRQKQMEFCVYTYGGLHKKFSFALFWNDSSHQYESISTFAVYDPGAQTPSFVDQVREESVLTKETASEIMADFRNDVALTGVTSKSGTWGNEDLYFFWIRGQKGVYFTSKMTEDYPGITEFKNRLVATSVGKFFVKQGLKL